MESAMERNITYPRCLHLYLDADRLVRRWYPTFQASLQLTRHLLVIRDRQVEL